MVAPLLTLFGGHWGHKGPDVSQGRPLSALELPRRPKFRNFALEKFYQLKRAQLLWKRTNKVRNRVENIFQVEI